MHQPTDNLPTTVDRILERVDELRDLNQHHLAMRQVMRAVLNGGADAVAHLISDSDMEHLPSANLIHSGIERNAQKLRDAPKVRIDPPRHIEDSANSRTKAEKRERIVEAYDAAANVRMQVPQAARWIMGYGFCPWVIEPDQTWDGRLFPSMSLRDPYGALPGPWTVHQQPDDIAFIRKIPEQRLRALYPGLPRNLKPGRVMVGGAVLLDNTTGQWASQNEDDTLRVIEYRNATGTYLILEQSKILLDFTPTPEGVGTPFVIAKRFAFDELQGQFQHVVGLQQMLSRLTVLAFLSVQDAVFAETNIYGEMVSDEYRRGRGAINQFSLQTRVERPTDGNVFQAFQQNDRIERQLRLTGAYPVTDDAQSPNSFVTGRGLEELTQGSDNVVSEYQLVLRDTFERADFKRLRWDDAAFPDAHRVLPDQNPDATNAEKYTPQRDIAGNYQTRRIYGLLAGLDSSRRLVGLLQVAQAGWVDDLTATENIDGIDDVQQIRDRLRAQRAEEMLQQAMMTLAQGQPMDPRVLRVILDQVPEGPLKEQYEAVFFPEEDPQQQQQQPQLNQPQQPAAQPGEDAQTVLSRLFSSGSQTSAAQVVQRT